ncbi:tripartite tricarboxylate transporter substrate binding protein, partial [Bordetella hinzii]|nr:tripartite tricarboxylate transporter substrate binding protein [Bordetella hinzii]
MIPSFLTRRAVLLGSLLMSLGAHAWAAEDNWPQRPIRMVVAGSPGAGGDIFARLISAPLAKALK